MSAVKLCGGRELSDTVSPDMAGEGSDTFAAAGLGSAVIVGVGTMPQDNPATGRFVTESVGLSSAFLAGSGFETLPAVSGVVRPFTTSKFLENSSRIASRTAANSPPDPGIGGEPFVVSAATAATVWNIESTGMLRPTDPFRSG